MAAVDHHVLARIQRVRINQKERMMRNIKFITPNLNRLLSPPNRQPTRNHSQQLVARWISPQNQIRRLDILVAQISISFDLHFASKQSAPLLLCTNQLRIGPLLTLLVERFSRGYDEN